MLWIEISFHRVRPVVLHPGLTSESSAEFLNINYVRMLRFWFSASGMGDKCRYLLKYSTGDSDTQSELRVSDLKLHSSTFLMRKQLSLLLLRCCLILSNPESTQPPPLSALKFGRLK